MADWSKTLTRRLVKLSTTALPGSLGVSVAHRLRARDERSHARRADFVVLSHAKSGRTWLRVMLSRLFQQRHGLPEREILEFDNWHRREPAVPVIHFTHGHYLGPLYEGGAGPARRTVFLARDPLDIAVSQFFHTQKRTKAYKKRLHGVDGEGEADLFGFVMQSALGLPEIVEYLNAWERRLAGRDDVLVVAYEPLRAAPEAEIRRICDFLGFDFSDAEIAEAVAFGDFDRMKEMERTRYFESNRLATADPQDADAYKVRRAKVGGWRDYVDAAQAAELEEYVRKHLAPAYGYGTGA